ncbi:hypothetical protein VTN00DRAFT_1724 [Thermoascus crustaceus]|uniref:uncharacterized protein n=1 Tax=Thermoascus crustaceus TaxID=5088 RepID=UPI0037447C9B
MDRISHGGLSHDRKSRGSHTVSAQAGTWRLCIVSGTPEQISRMSPLQDDPDDAPQNKSAGMQVRDGSAFWLLRARLSARPVGLVLRQMQPVQIAAPSYNFALSTRVDCADAGTHLM